MSSDILLVGEPMGLFIAKNEGPLEQVTDYSLAVAGAEFNVAVGLSRLGYKVSYLTKLGNDPFGKLMANTLEQNNIDSKLVIYTDNSPTGFMLKSMVSEGDPEIFYFRKNSAASTLSIQDIEKIDFSGYGYLHLTGIFPALSPTTCEAAFYLLEKAKKSGLTITFDPNLRPQLWKDRETMIEVINRLAVQADIVFPGQAEGLILAGSEDPRVISDFYISKGVKIVVTKLGSKGAFVATSDEQFIVPGFKVEKVIDTVGAGDGFAAGTISGLIDRKDIKDSVLRGNAVGAIQVMSRGDNDGLPTREQLAAFMGLNLL